MEYRMMVTAIYDANCVICRQSKRIVNALDWLHRVEFLDLQNWEVVNARYPALDWNAAFGQMHTMTPDGQMIGGFKGVRALLRQLPLGFPIWLLLHIPGIDWIGEQVYKFIARNRYTINKLVGAPVCENGACRLHNPAG
jgi:predicted DCC family thiol-disulfide oxidoreductase YuxK